MRLVDCIRKILGLKAERGPCVIERPFFSVLLLQPVSRVKLHTWLIRVDIHSPAALLREYLRGETEIAADMGEAPVMVITVSLNKLVEIIVDPLSDHMEIREIHRSSLYWANLSSWDRCLIGRGVKISKNPCFVVEDGTSVIAEEVEISMVCQVHRRVRIGKDTVCQRQHI